MRDEELVGQVQNGKIEVFGEVVSRYERRLYGYIRNLTNRNRQEVEDMLQDVFIKSYANIQGFDTRKNFGGWIFKIAHNVAIDRMKRRQEVNIGDDNEDFWDNVEDKTSLVEELAIKEEERIRLVEAIERLEINYKEAILLYYFEEKSYDDIAEILHTSISNVGVTLMRAREKIKKLLINNY